MLHKSLLLSLPSPTVVDTNVGAIVGGVLGSSSLCILACVAIMMFICCIKKRRKGNANVMYHIGDDITCEIQPNKVTLSDCPDNPSTEAYIYI